MVPCTARGLAEESTLGAAMEPIPHPFKTAAPAIARPHNVTLKLEEYEGNFIVAILAQGSCAGGFPLR
jgi:hypothetical protein